MTQVATLTPCQAARFNRHSKQLIQQIVQHLSSDYAEWDRSVVVMRDNFILTLFFAARNSSLIDSRKTLQRFLDKLNVPHVLDAKATFPYGSEYYSLRLWYGGNNFTNIDYITVDELYCTITFQLV